VYHKESLLLLALLRTLWRQSYQELHDWWCAWPALALACGLPPGPDGQPWEPQASMFSFSCSGQEERESARLTPVRRESAVSQKIPAVLSPMMTDHVVRLPSVSPRSKANSAPPPKRGLTHIPI
jgi:hypothetical protein